MTDEVIINNVDSEENELKKVFNDKTEEILRELNLNVETLDSSDFSVVDYINDMFPNEQSLASIDDIMEGIEYRIKDLDEETRRTLRGQWKSESNGHAAVQEATSMIQDLFQKIREVQSQATQSENMVKEITRDIQQLDLAKKNLTVSITTLNNLTLIMGSVDRLKLLLNLSASDDKCIENSSTVTKATVSAPPKQKPSNPFDDNPNGSANDASATNNSSSLVSINYTEIDEHLAHSTKILSQLKQQFPDIPVIKDLDADMTLIMKELGQGKLQTDIRHVLMSGKVNANNHDLRDQLHAMCRVIDQIQIPPTKTGPTTSNRLQLTKWFLDHQLSEYRVLFDETQTTAWLDRIDHRYSWLRSNLLNFDKRFNLYFPKSWMMIERLIVEFCEYTRNALQSLMRQRKSELTDNLVIFAIKRTQMFEDMLKKSFCADSLRDLLRKLNNTDESVDAEESQKKVKLEDLGDKNPFVEEIIKNNTAAPDSVSNSRSNFDEDDLEDDPIDGIISSCFETHLHLYIEEVNRVLNEQLKTHLMNDFTVNEASINDKEFEEVLGDIDKKGSVGGSGGAGSSKLAFGAQVDSAENSLNSATNLFLLYRKLLTQAPQLSRGMPLVELSKVLARYLREYNTKVLLSQLPAHTLASAATTTTSSSFDNDAASSIHGSSSNADLTSHTDNTGQPGDSSTSDLAANVQSVSSVALTAAANQIFHSFMKDDHQSSRMTKEEIKKVCVVLVTASYCLKTVEELERRLKLKVRPQQKLAPLIDLSGEVEQFRLTRSHCVSVLSKELEVAACEPALTQMVRTNWAILQAVSDQSTYVSLIGHKLQEMIGVMRPPLNGVRAFFTQICIQFAGGFTARFLAALFRCRLPTTVAAEQLLLDTHSIKTVLLKLPVLGLKVHPEPPRSFTTVVLQGMGRAEKIVKTALTPVTTVPPSSSGSLQFVETALHLLPDTDSVELQRVLDMRCIRRPDQTCILEEFKRRKGHNNSTNNSSTNTLSNKNKDESQTQKLVGSLSTNQEAKKMSQLERLINIIK